MIFSLFSFVCLTWGDFIDDEIGIYRVFIAGSMMSPAHLDCVFAISTSRTTMENKTWNVLCHPLYFCRIIKLINLNYSYGMCKS